MATAIFYANTSDDRKVDKTLTEITTKTVEYKGDTSIINPQIKVSVFNDFGKCNYVYLSDTKRYYFVRNITMSQQNIIIELECDVLYTYRTDIRRQKAILKRQRNKCNYYLDDEKFRALEYSRIQTFAFPTGFTQNAFVITIAGGR